jgi:putative acetyltransferase
MSTLSSPAVHLRLEQPGDAIPIRQINESAFGGNVEADLIDALRAADAVALSVVAVINANSPEGQDMHTVGPDSVHKGEIVGGDIVGHALFTPITVTTETGEVQLLALGPVAVLPARQHRGIGTMMISGCLEHLRASGKRGVVVVGEPGYYRRFGFIQASRWSLRSDMVEVPEENFLALELTPGALTGVSGVARYRPEFHEGL